MQANTVHPCDERLPAGQLLTLGIQHVLVMYAGAVAVPLIIGSALNLPKDQIAFLISADLFSCGIATLIQTLGLWIFGIRLPVIMGCTFAAVSPMIAIGTNPNLGILDIFGSTIAAGVAFGTKKPTQKVMSNPSPKITWVRLMTATRDGIPTA